MNPCNLLNWSRSGPPRRRNALTLPGLGALLAVALLGVGQGSALPVVTASGTGAAYTALSPTRILDTRLTDATLGPQTTLALRVVGLSGVPTAATAVALNVTVTDTTTASFLTVYPTGEATPLISSLNWTAGETRANLVVVPVGSGGSVTFYNDSGCTDVVVDLQGYFSVPAGTGMGEYVPLSPSRIADTRPGSGEPYAGDTLRSAQSLDIQVTGMGGIPASGVSAAVLNVTATDTTAAGFLSIYPQGQPNPGTSTLNWSPGLTVAARVLVRVGSSGQITVYNSTGSTDVVVDVDGYFTTGTTSAAGASLFYPLSPTRVLDTRAVGGTLGPGRYLSERFAGLAGVAQGASAILVNLTATNTSADSFFTIAPTQGGPSTSDLNWTAGNTVANLAIPTLNSSGDASLYNDQGSTDAVIDLFGYFQPVSGSGGGAPSCTVASLQAPAQSSIPAPLTVTATATCPAGTTSYYTYWYESPGSPGWTSAESSSTSPSYSYVTTGWSTGAYQLRVWVTTESGVYQQLSATATTQLSLPPCTGVSVVVSPNPGLVSAPVVIQATSECPSMDTPYYSFSETAVGSSASPTELGNGWTTGATLVVGTEGWAAGAYTFTVGISSVPSGAPQAQAAAADTLQASGTILVPNVPYSAQAYGEDCEEAVLEMALAHDGILLQGNNIQSQNDILGAEGIDWHVPGIGPSYTSGDPMQNFVGPPTGGQTSGYEPGAYYGAVAKAAVAFGATVIAAGEGITPAQVYAFVEQGHPVQTWVSFNFQHYNPVYLTNGVDTWPWVGPQEHSVLVVGIGVNEVLIDNPWPTAVPGSAYVGPDQWVPMSIFEGAYSSFNDMAVVLS